ncbi:unnamed protein product [Ceratitis capitata]|uniref:(Mediterranean fruit fly) hypothetical protein n=1 Tax=Ceratitis capitata TaxID=7213 RepID=A0A811VJX3_CERCA|nr:unnamed protein product [Ceratitis capitata]
MEAHQKDNTPFNSHIPIPQLHVQSTITKPKTNPQQMETMTQPPSMRKANPVDPVQVKLIPSFGTSAVALKIITIMLIMEMEFAAVVATAAVEEDQTAKWHYGVHSYSWEDESKQVSHRKTSRAGGMQAAREVCICDEALKSVDATQATIVL